MLSREVDMTACRNEPDAAAHMTCALIIVSRLSYMSITVFQSPKKHLYPQCGRIESMGGCHAGYRITV